MFNLEYAKNPAYKNELGSEIDLVVKWAEFDQELPFAASPDDIYEHGRSLFARASNGEFGPVAPYVPPPEQSVVAAQDQPTVSGAQTL